MTAPRMHRLTRHAIVVILLGASARPTTAQRVVDTQDAERAPPVDTGGSKSKALPAVEVGSFLVLLSAYDRVAYAGAMQDGKKVYSSTFATTWDHLRDQTWVHDQDPFNVNQFAHPYQGATMFAFARSSGLGFWRSLAYSNAGSFAWKMAGETDPPSSNDMITTGQAGSLLGEALYRIADLVLKDGGDKSPWWHEYLATMTSPPTGLNRRALGRQFRSALPDSAPATSWQLRVGATSDALERDLSAHVTLLRYDATAELSVSYGLPGRPGYDYTRPLDYFDLQ